MDVSLIQGREDDDDRKQRKKDQNMKEQKVLGEKWIEIRNWRRQSRKKRSNRERRQE